MEQKHLTFWDWVILLALLAFTAGGTAGVVEVTSSESGALLFARQAAAIVFTDGVILYWHSRRARYVDKEQRKWANFALWASVGVVLLFTLIYGVEAVIGATNYTVDTGAGVVSIAEALGVLVAVMLGAQAAGTLALILYIEQLSPDSKMAAEAKAAEGRIAERQLTDFRTAQEAIAPIVGQAQAIARLKAQLSAMGYNEVETAALVARAEGKIKAGKLPEAAGADFLSPPPAKEAARAGSWLVAGE